MTRPEESTKGRVNGVTAEYASNVKRETDDLGTKANHWFGRVGRCNRRFVNIRKSQASRTEQTYGQVRMPNIFKAYSTLASRGEKIDGSIEGPGTAGLTIVQINV